MPDLWGEEPAPWLRRAFLMVSPREQAIAVVRLTLLDDPDLAAQPDWLDCLAERLVDRLLAERVPCPTCGAKGYVRQDVDGRRNSRVPCPGCTDGYGGPLILLGPEAVEGWCMYPPGSANGGTYPLVHPWADGCEREPVCIPVYVARPESEER